MESSVELMKEFFFIKWKTPNKAEKYRQIIEAIEDGGFEQNFSMNQKVQYVFYMIINRIFTIIYTGFYYYFAPFFITFCLIIGNASNVGTSSFHDSNA